MSMRRLTVFLSSTGKDLAPYRAAIMQHMRASDGFICDAMEDFGARDASAVDLCRERVEAADVLVGLIGHYRGWEPQGCNKNRSITEMEFDWASDLNRSRLMFVAPEGQAARADLAMTEAQHTRQTLFRARVMESTVYDRRFYDGKFTSPDALAAAVMTALANLQYGRMLQALRAAGAHAPLTGGGLESPSIPQHATERAEASPVDALNALLQDKDFAGLLSDPALFDIEAIEATLSNRAIQRLTAATGSEAQAKTHRRAAAADYKRLAELTGWFDAPKARTLYEKAVAADPDDFWAHIELGNKSMAVGSLPSAQRAYNAARQLAERAVQADPGNAGRQRDLSVSHDRIGDVLSLQGDLPAALDAFKKSLAVADHLAKTDPGNAEWQRDLSISYNKIGDVLSAQGDLPAALDGFKKSLAIRDRLAKTDPGNAGWQRDLSVSHSKIGDVLRAQGDLPKAFDAYKTYLAITDRLAKTDPGNAGWQRDLSISHDKIGDVLSAQGDLPAALDSFKKSLAIRDRLTKTDPGNAGWQRDLSISQNKIGDVLSAQGDLPAALEAYKTSLAIRDRLAKTDPGNAEWQRDLSVSHDKIGRTLEALGRLDDALPYYAADLAITERLTAHDPSNATWRKDAEISRARMKRLGGKQSQ